MSLLRMGILATLTLSTTASVSLLRWTRRSVDLYFQTTALFIIELCKFATCLIVLFWQHGFSGACHVFLKDIIQNVYETSRLILPAALYALQNNLLFFALTFLDTTTYQVTYQLKILTTALFSVVILRRRLRGLQWLALVLLSAGVMMVQVENAEFYLNQNETAEKQSVNSHSSKVGQSLPSEKMFGLLCVLAACLTSGFTGVYFEMLVKNTGQKSLIVRNLQLEMISILITLLVVILDDFKGKGFFYGYSIGTVLLIAQQTFSSLLVAVVIKYADNILKVFATSISIILCAIISKFFIEDSSSVQAEKGYQQFIHLGNFLMEQDTMENLLFLLGTSLVIASSFLYSLVSSSGDSQKSSQKPNNNQELGETKFTTNFA